MGAELRTQTVRAGSSGPIVLRFEGEVDASNVAEFRRALDTADPSSTPTSATRTSSAPCAAATRATPPQVVVDLAGLTYLDSAGVDVLFDVARRQTLAVVAPPGSAVRRVLEIVSLDTAAALCDALDDARAARDLPAGSSPGV